MVPWSQSIPNKINTIKTKSPRHPLLIVPHIHSQNKTYHHLHDCYNHHSKQFQSPKTDLLIHHFDACLSCICIITGIVTDRTIPNELLVHKIIPFSFDRHSWTAICSSGCLLIGDILNISRIRLLARISNNYQYSYGKHLFPRKPTYYHTNLVQRFRHSIP